MDVHRRRATTTTPAARSPTASPRRTRSISVTPYSVTYDGTAHTATGTATGSAGREPERWSGPQRHDAHERRQLSDRPLDLHRRPPTTTTPAARSTTTSPRRTPTIMVTPYNVTYDGSRAHGHRHGDGCGRGESERLLDLSGTTHTDAGNYPTTLDLHRRPRNYNNASGTVSDTIAKANADDLGHTLQRDLQRRLRTRRPARRRACEREPERAGPEWHHAHQRRQLHRDAWTFTDVTGNYNNASGTVDDSIAKANAVILVTPYNVTYDGAAHTATGTATGVLSESLSGPEPEWHHPHQRRQLQRRRLDLHRRDRQLQQRQRHGRRQHRQGQRRHLGHALQRDLQRRPRTRRPARRRGRAGENLSSLLDLSGTTHTNAGNYPTRPWTFTDDTATTTTPAAPSPTASPRPTPPSSVTPYSVTYDGAAHTATGTATGAGART